MIKLRISVKRLTIQYNGVRRWSMNYICLRSIRLIGQMKSKLKPTNLNQATVDAFSGRPEFRSPIYLRRGSDES